MAFSYIGISNIKNSTGDNECRLTPNSSTAVGDIMFAHICTTVGYANNLPSGWTKLAENTGGSGNYYQLFYKVKTVSGTEGQYLWTYSDVQIVYGHITTYRDGFNTSNPIDTYSNTQYIVNNPTVRAASMTVSKTNSPLLFFCGVYYSSVPQFDRPNNPTSSSDWTTRKASGGTSGFYTALCDMVWISSGATGDMNGNINVSKTQKHCFAVALNTPVSGPANLKSYNTNLKANIKTINTNPIANVKSLNTNV